MGSLIEHALHFISPAFYNLLFVDLLDCSCSSFVDADGYGNCEKQDMNEFGCYVNEPSTCTDLASYDMGKYSISQACKGIFAKIKDLSDLDIRVILSISLFHLFRIHMDRKIVLSNFLQNSRIPSLF